MAASNLLNVAVREEMPNIFIQLTVRERDCLSWIARGLRPAEICWRLKISEKTFEKHISSAKLKLKSRTRDQALAKAVLLDLLQL
jgi:DNA-binding CsgD family transcriptional regulator